MGGGNVALRRQNTKLIAYKDAVAELHALYGVCILDVVFDSGTPTVSNIERQRDVVIAAFSPNNNHVWLNI